jgi:hypothetical protein
MYINQIDELFDTIINNFNIYLIKQNIFDKFSKDNNFVKFQNDILDTIQKYIDNIDIILIEKLTNKKQRVQSIVEIIKRYCAFYIYLGISYYYKGDRELFITNIIETSKNIKDSTFSISNFFNSDNNAKIILMYTIIKDIIQLQEYKTIERIKIILGNEPVKYAPTIILLNQLGEDYFNEYFLIKDNFHNIIKTFIFRQIYLLEEKNDIIKMLDETELDEAEYKYIDIVLSKHDKMIDFTFLQEILSIDMLKSGKAEEYYSYLEDYKDTSNLHLLNNNKMIDFLFSNKIIVPITEEFLRYHKNTEKYDKDNSDLKDRDATKIKYIINKVNKVMNIYSSTYDKNQKLKLEAMNLFYKSLEYKDAILYNDNEEVKIINKLEMSENTTDLDYIIDLNNIRAYPYVNYKDFSKDGFKLRSSLMIQGIRNSNITHTNPKNRPIELRVGHILLPLNVVGIVFNPSKRHLECSNTSNLVNVRGKHSNGFNQFIKIMEKNNKKDKQLYYWLFDLAIDKIKLEQYKNVSSTDSKIVIENILGEIFAHYIETQKNIIYDELKQKKPSDIWEIQRLINRYRNKYRFTENIDPNLLYIDVFDKYYTKVIKDIPMSDKTLEPKKQIIKIPLSKKIKTKDITIILNEKVETVDLSIYLPICHHYIKWIELSKLSNKNDDKNQAIFDFVKQYVKTNERNEYICKSCSELLDLKKYVYEGTYVAELDTFQTTNLAVNQKLEEMPKYAKYTRTIRNIEKNIEKICYAINLPYYLGNTPVIKLRRKLIIKDTIDLILIHGEYLKTQPKDRKQKAAEMYNINSDLSNLFFFELKDDVFLTSSLDTDYYKQIKFNNVLAYILLILVADLNTGQIISMKDDKKCNYFLYSNIGEALFSKLYIRISEKEKILVSSIPLLAYVLFYMSCVLTNSYIWLWNSTDAKNQYNIQKTIIHTMIDLINTLVEANMLKDKNFLYELIVNRLMYKIKNTYVDANALNLINIETQKKIKIDSVTHKISYIVKKDKIIDIVNSAKFNPMNPNVIVCDTKTDMLEIKQIKLFDNTNDIYTNCIDGRFHEWDLKNKKLTCNLCNVVYDDIESNHSKKTDSVENINRIVQLKNLYLLKLAKQYCTSGSLHELDAEGICNKCKINPSTYEYKQDDLIKLNKNLKQLSDMKAVKQLDKVRKYFEKEQKRIDTNEKLIANQNDFYIKTTDNKMINYIDDFIDIMIKNLGNKIKIDNKTIYLKDTMYIVRNDYLGNDIKEPITILSSENKIQTNYNAHFKIIVLYYHDKINNVYVYYNGLTKNYIGYSKDNKTFISYKSSNYIEIINSVKNMIIYMGLENQFYSIYHISRQYMYGKKEDIPSIYTEIIRNRCNNLRQCIYRSASIIEKVKNVHSNKFNMYNLDEQKLVADFQRNLKNFNTKNDKDEIFNSIYNFTNNIKISSIDINEKVNPMSKQYIDTSILITLNNMDCKLLFYYLSNMSRLIEYNDLPAIRTNLCYMIIKLIIFNYSMYYIPNENSQIRKFDSLLLTETPYMDESMKVVGYYQELVNTKEIDDEKQKEANYDNKEELDAIDINAIDGGENDPDDLDYDAMDEMLEHQTDW